MGYQALLFCPDEKLARVVSQVFGDLDFAIDAVSEPFGAVKKLMAQHYDAVVVDCDNEQNTALLFRSARNSTSNQSALAIALVEGQAGVAKAYRIGANLVLTKPINVEQAKGTLRVARGLLRKTSDASASAASATPSSAVRTPVAASPAVSAVATPASAPAPSHIEAPAFESPEPAISAWAKTEANIETKTEARPEATKIEAKVPEKPAFVPAPAASIPAQLGSYNAAQTALDAFEQVRTESPAAHAANSPAPAVSAAGMSQTTGAATAPAKSATAPPEAIPQKKDKETPIVKPAYPVHEHEPEHAASMQATVDAPSFGALSNEAATGSSGSKKGLIAAAAILALAAAGYFGWTKFGRPHPNSAPPEAPQQQQNASPGVLPMSAPATAPAPATNRASTPAGFAKPSAVQIEPLAAGTSSSAAPSSTRLALDSGPPAPKPAPLLVKPAVPHKAKGTADDVAAQAPSPLAVGSPSEGDLSGVVSTTAAAKPVLARVRLSQGVSQGLLIKRVPPKYPANALANHIRGTVLIEATINKDGNVVNPKAVNGDPTLAAAALDAVRQWRYKPYYLDGEPVEVQTQITINFRPE